VRLLFVCCGNTCRSPMAAAFAMARFGAAAVVESAGIECGSGISAAQNAIAVMHKRGLDIYNHRSTDIEDLDFSQFDVVVAMDPNVARRLEQLNPKRLEQWNVADPYGGDIARYRSTADAIQAAVDELSL
jgi:protein-tyrosine-phosphatase